MKKTRSRMASAGLAAATVLAMGATPAAAQSDGPYVFDAVGTGQALTVTVGLPPALADALAPVLDLPGIQLVDSQLQINLAGVLGELQLPLAGDLPGNVLALARADTLTGSLDGLLGAVRCINSPIDVVVPPGASTPLISLQLLQAECVADESGRLTVASSKVANLSVQLSGLFALLPPELSDPLTSTLDEVIETVQTTLLGPLTEQVIQPVQDVVNDLLGLDLDLTEAIRIPELLDMPLISVKLIESTTRNLIDGDAIRSLSEATLAGVSLLGTICIPDITFSSVAWATGLPGGNGYSTSAPPVDLAICDTATLNPILRLLESGGVLNDVMLNLGGGVLRPIGEVLDGTGLPLSDLINAVDDLLAQLGVSTIVQGTGTGTASADGRTASSSVTPLRVGADLNNLFGGTPLEGLGVWVAANTVTTAVAAAPAPPEAPPITPVTVEPPQPTPDSSLPRTGAGALLAMAGVLAMSGAMTLRRRD